MLKRRHMHDSRFWVDGDIVREERRNQILSRTDATTTRYLSNPTGFEREVRGSFSGVTYSNYYDTGTMCLRMGSSVDDKPFCKEHGEILAFSAQMLPHRSANDARLRFETRHTLHCRCSSRTI